MGENWEEYDQALSRVSMSAKKKVAKRTSLDEEDFLNLLHGSDPVKMELNRLHNEVKDKDRELAEAHGEIKSLRLTERAKDKALAEVSEELDKMMEKLQASEATIESKNLEIKKISEEKKEALAAQFAAEATLRRVHAEQRDEDLPPLETILAPLEAEIKLLRLELSKLQDDNKAFERLTKSKEVALMEAEREVQFANIKAAMVDDLLNKNQELTKQNDICQEEYKILDKMHRQKVAEVEKLGQTVHELEEALHSGAAAANALRDYQRQVNELKGEKKTLERTLSRAMVTENRIAVATANEWKDANDKVMPVRQWLEERRVLMGEMQQLREKLAISERATKTEAQLKERLQLRLKVVEDGLKTSLRSGAYYDNRSNAILSRSRSVNGADVSLSISSSGRKSSTVSLRLPALPSPTNVMLKHAKGASKSFDGGRSSVAEQCRKKLSYGDACKNDSLRDEIEELSISSTSGEVDEHTNGTPIQNIEEHTNGKPIEHVEDDYVSAVFYDVLQKEVIALRKACYEKEQCLKDKDSSIEMLSKKIDTLTKAMEVETKKLRREKAVLEREVAALRVEREQEQKSRRFKGL